jgi:tRNA wybutosine-synthesizing protein 2
VSDHEDARLAAVVSKPDAEAAIDSLQQEGVYDDSRRVEAHDADTVALPVTARPSATAVRDVVETDLPRRERGLRDILRSKGWTADDLESTPSSWAVVGSVVLVDVADCPNPEAVGEALLSLHGEADTVLAREGISGQTREPDVEVLAGEGDTETVHTEHGTRYAMDLAEVMFSPGNEAERSGMADRVEAGERVFDMFAGIGYFALPMARAGADVTAVELNPEAYRYLVENAQLNNVTGNLQAILGDCRDVDASADRVVMGYYGVSERDDDSAKEESARDHEAFDYLDAALDALEPGGVLHVHAAVHESELPDGPADRVRDAASDRGRDATVDAVRRVKSHSAGVAHVVVDATVD